MSITKKFLEGLKLDDSLVETILEAHIETVNGLKEKISQYKEDAERLPTVQKELDNLKSMTADYDEWKTKYNDEHKAFEDFKADVSAKETATKIRNAYKDLLKTGNVDEKRFDSILKVTDFSDLKLNKEGKFDNEKELSESIANEWKDFIVTTGTRGAEIPEKPLESQGSSLTADAKYIRERAARRHAGTYGELATKE